MTTAGARRCLVLGAGDYYDGQPNAGRGAGRDFVVAADGGWDHARELGLRVDVLIGDLDSLRGHPDHGLHVMRLPAEKDQTDMLAAVATGWSHGLRTFDIYGGLGGRIDHTIANIQLLADIARHGGAGRLYGDGVIVTAIARGSLTFPAWLAPPRSMLSIFAHSDRVEGVTERGLKYRLDHVEMRNTEVLGISNEFLARTPASLEVERGTLIVCYPELAPEPQRRTSVPATASLAQVSSSVSPLLSRPDQAGHRNARRQNQAPVLVCYQHCSTCAKARTWLREHHVDYEERDIRGNNPSYHELKAWWRRSGLPVRRFFNTSGRSYRALHVKDRLPTMSDDDALRLLATDGMLVKRPLVVSAHGILVGFRPDEWAAALP